MRTPKGLFFAPSTRFKDLDLGVPAVLAGALQDRAEKWFFEPAAAVVDSSPFASGVIVTCFMDAAAEFAGVDFVEWLKEAVPCSANLDPRGTKRSIADSFYEDVRNGLVHHARLSRGAEFSVDLDGVVEVVDRVLIVNPRALLQAVIAKWKDFVLRVRSTPAIQRATATHIERTFRVDFEADRNWR